MDATRAVTITEFPMQPAVTFVKKAYDIYLPDLPDELDVLPNTATATAAIAELAQAVSLKLNLVQDNLKKMPINEFSLSEEGMKMLFCYHDYADCYRKLGIQSRSLMDVIAERLSGDAQFKLAHEKLLAVEQQHEQLVQEAKKKLTESCDDFSVANPSLVGERVPDIPLFNTSTGKTEGLHSILQEVGKFAEQGCQVVLVASMEMEHGKTLLEKYDVSLPFYLDRDRALYRQMGLGRTPDLVSLIVVELYASFQVVGKGRDAVGPDEDMFSNGGDFIIDRTGLVKYWRRTIAYERPPVSFLLDALKADTTSK